MQFGEIREPVLRGRFRLGSARRVFLNGVIAAFVCCVGAAASAQPGKLDAEAVKRIKATLEESGIEPTVDGLKRYLEDLHPNAETTTRLAKLIADLGDDDFFQREEAMRELLRLPVHSPELFQKAIEAGDPEIRWRVREVLKQSSRRTEQMLHSTLQLIRQENMHGLAELVVKSVPFCTENYIREEAIRTLKAIASASDVSFLKAALKEPDPRTQQLAIVALEHLLGADADVELLSYLDAKNPELRLTAAKALANHGERRALSALVELLEAEDLETRAHAAQILQAVTGQRFSFVAYDTQEKRDIARNEWIHWVKAHGETAKLNFPIPDGPLLKHHTLICNYSFKKVIELDANYNEIWSTEIVGAWGCQGLPNGHRLVTSYSQRFIVEYDLAGKEVWKKDQLPGLPYSVERLDNGDTLVTCSNNQVLEYAPDGSIAWQKTFNGTPRDAQRLDNGHTLVVLYSTQEIVEVDRDGNQVWRQGNLTRPMSGQRLPNGNTLICQSAGQQVVEMDRKGAVVWSQNLPQSVYDAQRLPNGNTLVVGSTGAAEYDPKGTAVWQLNQPGMRGIHRF
jgi:HEAT repeat protein